MALIATAATLALLGGTLKVALPVDDRVAVLEDQLAANWVEQRDYHKRRELDEIRWRMRWVTQEINRINMIPKYMNRRLSDEERWQIQQLQKEWQLLKEREMELMR